MNDKLSFNNKIIVEAYVKGEIRSKERNGFALIDQKGRLHGLKVLVESKLNDKQVIPAGSIAYFKEEDLHTQAWAGKILECDVIEGKFIIVDLSHVQFFNFPTNSEFL